MSFYFAEAMKMGNKLEAEGNIQRMCGRQTKRANTSAAAEEYCRRIPLLDLLNRQISVGRDVTKIAPVRFSCQN